MTEKDISSLLNAMRLPPMKSPEDRSADIRNHVAMAARWTDRNLIKAEDIAARGPGSEPARINMISLPSWLTIADMAGVAMIPAREIATFDAVDYFLAMDDLIDGASLAAFARSICKGLGADEILRFEQVAPGDLTSSPP